jgi:hypothetical protein
VAPFDDNGDDPKATTQLRTAPEEAKGQAVVMYPVDYSGDDPSPTVATRLRTAPKEAKLHERSHFPS